MKVFPKMRAGVWPLLIVSLSLSAASWSQDAKPGDSQQASAQSTTSSTQSSDDPARQNKLGVSLVRNLAQDQWQIWTSPRDLRLKSLYWLLPTAGGLAFVTHYDSDISTRLPDGASFIKRSTDFSNYGIAAAVGTAGGMYLLGRMSGNEHQREAGFLSGEAAIDAFTLVTVAKYAGGRSRPNDLANQGDFRTGGVSFPSAHAAVAFSIATVLSNEYPGIGTKVLSYGAATGIAGLRVLGRQHFVTDVAVGSAIGWFSGREVYRLHHKTDLPGESIGTIVPSREPQLRKPGDMASPYVELDSWIYPAFDRLAALGLLRTGFASIRPWTRMECARQVAEAGDRLGEGGEESPVFAVYKVLKSEFEPELKRLDGEANVSATVESVYTRETYIFGRPLTDSYHFGQTVINDYGRPFQEGFNSVTGGSARAVAGPFVFYVRGEYQHAPGAAALSQQVENAIAEADRHVASPPTPFPEVNRARLLDAYVGVQVKNWLLSFGKQSTWWGPGENSPMLFSDNAEPIMMLKLDRVTPFRIPFASTLLGPLRMQVFVGQLSGHQFVFTEQGPFSNLVGRPVDPQPFINGAKLSMKPTPNFEFSVSRTGVFGGPAFPFTLSRFSRAVFSNANAFGLNDPGDRRGGADMSYRVPKLRDWLTLYVDAMTEDQPSPLLFPERSAVRGGFHMPQLPRLRNVELWAEGSYTDLPAGTEITGFHYFNVRYLSGYTNQGNVLGGWVGRQGVGGATSTRWWVRPDSSIQVSYRNNRISSQFMQGGGRQHDLACTVDVGTSSGFRVGGSAQYERWRIPILSGRQEQNLALSIQVSYMPKLFRKQSLRQEAN